MPFLPPSPGPLKLVQGGLVSLHLEVVLPWDPSVGDEPWLCFAVIMPTFLSNTMEIVNISPHDNVKKGCGLR